MFVTLIYLVFCLLFGLVHLPVATLGPVLRKPIVYTCADGVWEILLVILSMYCMIPARLIVVAFIGTMLPVAHLIVCLVQSNPQIFWPMVSRIILYSKSCNGH